MKEKSVQKVHISQLARRERHAESIVEQLPQWPELKAAIDGGLAAQEAVQLALPCDSDIHVRTVTRFLQKYVRSLGYRYTVKHVKREPFKYFQVINYTPITKRKQA